METELLEQISHRLGVLIALVLLEKPYSQSKKDHVATFSRLGLSNQEIADLLAVKKETVETFKSRTKKK